MAKKKSEEKEKIEEEGEEKESAVEERDEIEELRRERDEYREKYLRKMAEMDNYRKMLEREKEMEMQRCRANIVKEFIDVYENLQRAAEDSGDEGLSLVLKQMEKILSSLGVREMDAKGKKFDPMLHEAIGVVEGEEDGIVAEVYQQGYMLNDLVLRHAKVLVSKKKEVNEDEREDNRN